jgi:hypothetical protein
MAGAGLFGLSEYCSLPTCHHPLHPFAMQRQIQGSWNIFQANARCKAPANHAARSRVVSKRHFLINSVSSRNNCSSVSTLRNAPSSERLKPCQHGSVAVHCVQALERPISHTKSTESGAAGSLHGPAKEVADLILPRYNQSIGKVELVVAGAGPSGLAVAERVSQAGAGCISALFIAHPHMEEVVHQWSLVVRSFKPLEVIGAWYMQATRSA